MLDLERVAIEMALAGILRSADALQLASALQARRLASVNYLVTFDQRLATAAREYGMTVLDDTP